MPPKRRRQATAAVVPRGPNHQLNILRDQLDAQVKAEANLEATGDASIQDALEKDINNRNTILANTLDEFLHDPFSHQAVSDFSNAEKHALRGLRAALVNELDQSCEANRTALKKANGSLVLLMRPNTTGKTGVKQWVPLGYRSEDGEDEDEASMVPKFPDTVALEWRPRHMRVIPDQSVYEIENPDIKHSDPMDQSTWDTLSEQQPKPVEWRFESTDTEAEKKEARKKKKKTNGDEKKEQEKKKTEKRRTQDSFQDDTVKKQRLL